MASKVGWTGPYYIQQMLALGNESLLPGDVRVCVRVDELSESVKRSELGKVLKPGMEVHVPSTYGGDEKYVVTDIEDEEVVYWGEMAFSVSDVSEYRPHPDCPVWIPVVEG